MRGMTRLVFGYGVATGTVALHIYTMRMLENKKRIARAIEPVVITLREKQHTVQISDTPTRLIQDAPYFNV